MIEVGDLATWFQGVTSLGALVAAGIAAKVSFNVLRVENERDEAQRHREESAQAEQIAGWLTYNKAYRAGGIVGSGWRALLVNQSNLPIYDVTVTLCDTNGLVLGTSTPYHLLAPGESPLEVPTLQTVEDAEGQRHWRYSDNELKTYHLALHFRDTAGFGWTRGYDGRLTPDLAYDDPSRSIGETPATPLENGHGDE